MSDLKITQLPPNTFEELNDDDVFPIVNQLAGETRKISLFEMDKRWKALPSGGTVGQFLRKLIDGTTEWYTITKATIGLGQVNNTADIDKPLSNAAILALNNKATVTSVNAKANQTYVDAQLALKEDKLPVGTDGKVLGTVSGVPTWQDPPDSVADVKYFGVPTVDGTWRIRVTDGSLVIEVRDAGAWVESAIFRNPNL